jgi:quercetin dioxygenase-like cupin family protein
MVQRREFLQTLCAGALVAPSQPATPGGARMIHRQPLGPPFKGLDAAFVEVTIAPGTPSRAHRHSGFVLGYVLDGEFSFGVNGEPPRVVKAGDVFFEPAGAVHSSSGSARPDGPVKLLAIVIGPEGAPITTYDP